MTFFHDQWAGLRFTLPFQPQEEYGGVNDSHTVNQVVKLFDLPNRTFHPIKFVFWVNQLCSSFYMMGSFSMHDHSIIGVVRKLCEASEPPARILTSQTPRHWACGMCYRS